MKPGRRPRVVRVPPALRPGDRIGIVAPAGPVRKERLESGMAYLRGRGFDLLPGDHLFERRAYLAGDDAGRLGDLNRILADRSVKAVWFARGGYGSARIVEGVDFGPLATRPKALVGYSDSTVLHAAAFRAQRLVTYYGPNVSDLGDEESFDEASLWRALEGDESRGIEESLAGATVLRDGRAEGRLVGGCLSLLASLAGTPLQVPTEGAILFWEEVAEEPYRIDRMLGQLRQCGGFEGIRGMIVGQPVGCRAKEPANDLPLSEILERHLGKARIPVVLGVPAGHGPRKITLPLGRGALLDTGSATLRFNGR